MRIDFGTVLELAVTILTLVASRYLLPWIRAKASAATRSTLSLALDTLVAAAEQVYGSGAGQRKLAQVQAWAESRGMSCDTADIEAAVLRLKNALTA